MSPDSLTDAQRVLVSRVGGYLRNTERKPGLTCSVCTTPVDGYGTCVPCVRNARFGSALADLVAPVAYAGHNAQSKRLLYGYKQPLAARDDRRATVLLMLFVATGLHRACVESSVGVPIDAWTVVPSTRGRTDHPLPALASRIGLPATPVTATPAAEQPATPRVTSADRFHVDRPGSVRGRHVLVIDDTWTTGARLQSMALSLRDAGAAAVSGLVLARWISPDWPATAGYLTSTPHRDFDPQVCPVTGGSCL